VLDEEVIVVEEQHPYDEKHRCEQEFIGKPGRNAGQEIHENGLRQ
jgi:hypothetical protein